MGNAEYMGTIDFRYPFVSTTKTNMKLFLIAAVLIASVFAEPESEAKADAWYGAYGYGGYPYAGAYGAYAGGYRYLGKRSADSDAEAKPWLTYGAGYGYAGYPYAATYGAYAGPVATYAGAHLIGKRSADSDAEAKPWLAYSNYGYAGYPYASTYGAYAAPVAPYGHAAYTTPYATYGAHLIGKRSADSEPESLWSLRICFPIHHLWWIRCLPSIHLRTWCLWQIRIRMVITSQSKLVMFLSGLEY